MNSCKYCNKPTPKGQICLKCKQDRYRKSNPIRYAYSTLRTNAKRRGKFFDLTFDQFKAFAIKTKYYKKKGIYSDNYHIDRIDETGGYTIGNIQVLTNSANIRKYLDYKYDYDQRRMVANLTIQRHENTPDSNVPF